MKSVEEIAGDFGYAPSDQDYGVICNLIREVRQEQIKETSSAVTEAAARAYKLGMEAAARAYKLGMEDAARVAERFNFSPSSTPTAPE